MTHAVRQHCPARHHGPPAGSDGSIGEPEPRRQSGFSGPAEPWEACRRPIADCRDKSIEPWGLDLSEKLVTLARRRLPSAADNLFPGNGLTWQPPRTFDYVRTELTRVAVVPTGG